MKMIRLSPIGSGVALLLLLTACAGQIVVPVSPSVTPVTQTVPAPTRVPATTATEAMAGTDHGSTEVPFDVQFIDSMTIHHQGAVTMAKEAQQKAQRPEIKQLAAAIIKAQDAEIQQMQTWRTAWYPNLKDTGGLSMPAMQMGSMTVSDGPEPYDIRFINAMIPHHASAIAMAQEALQKAGKSEIKHLAQAIIAAQTAEIAQMQTWKAEWTAAGSATP